MESLFGATYSAPEAAALSGLSYRQVDYLAREDVVRPSCESAGPGTRRRYSDLDIARLDVAAALLGVGARYPVIRSVLEQLGDDPHEWPTFFFVTADGTIKRGLPLPASCWWISTKALAERREVLAAA